MSMPALSQHSLSVPRSGIRDVFDRVEHVPDAISLCVGEPSATAAPHIVEAACRSIREGHTTYTNVLGIEPFREAVAAYSEKVKGLRYDVDTEIQAVDGATIGLFLAMKALLDAGDEVILPSPYFTSYDAEALMCGGVPVPVALKPEHQMRLNADDIEAAITPRTKAVLLNSPATRPEPSRRYPSWSASPTSASGMTSGRSPTRCITRSSSTAPRQSRPPSPPSTACTSARSSSKACPRPSP